MKKPIGLWVILLISIVLISGCSRTDEQQVKSKVLNTIDNQTIESIKGMQLLDWGVTLGEVIEASLESPTYELYDPAADGNTYVTIRGNVLYNEQPIVATLQYKKLNDENYEFYTLAYNDIPQNLDEANYFFQYLYEAYSEKSNESSDEIAHSETRITYINNKYGYAIEYPKEWGEAIENDAGDGIVLLEDTMFDIRVYAEYMMSDSLENYIQEYYDGWSVTQENVSGAEAAYLLEYNGEESYQTAQIAYKDGTIYTFLVITTYIDTEYDFEKAQKIEDAIGEIEESFTIFDE